MFDRNKYMREYMKQRRKENPEHVRQVERNYIARLRQQILEKFDSKCAECGCNVIEILELNHLNGGGCQERRTSNWKSIYRKVIKNSKGYNLLCRVCNAKHYIETKFDVTGHKVIWG